MRGSYHHPVGISLKYPTEGIIITQTNTPYYAKRLPVVSLGRSVSVSISFCYLYDRVRPGMDGLLGSYYLTVTHIPVFPRIRFDNFELLLQYLRDVILS
jgi:hypothetical protein